MAFERVLLFLAPLAILMAAEWLWPKRQRTLRRVDRWPSAISLLAVGTGLTRLIAPAGLIGVAIWLQETGFGALPNAGLPALAVIVLAFIWLDFGVWLQHLVLHRVPFFWRFHRVHHADVDIDTSTALRFHPGELLFSFVWKAGFIVASGAPPLAVLLFEVVLNSSAMFNHSNLAVPKTVDRWLRLIIVTPDMHRVHHSVLKDESQMNFGFCLPWWDRLFGVYQEQPRAGHTNMQIGQASWRSAKEQSFWKLLTQPVEQEPGGKQQHEAEES